MLNCPAGRSNPTENLTGNHAPNGLFFFGVEKKIICNTSGSKARQQIKYQGREFESSRHGSFFDAKRIGNVAPLESEAVEEYEGPRSCEYDADRAGNEGKHEHEGIHQRNKYKEEIMLPQIIFSAIRKQY